MQDRLVVRHEDAWIDLSRDADPADRGSLEVRPGLATDDFVDLLLASGLVVQQEDGLQIDASTPCRELAMQAAEALSYFDAQSEPSLRLRQIREAVKAMVADRSLGVPSWYACAWLDLQLRNDLAEAARTFSSPWTSDNCQLDLDFYRRQRLAGFCERLVASAASLRKMAPTPRPRAEQSGTG